MDVEFDHARAVKSDEELESVRDSVRINTEGFYVFLEEYAPGRSGCGGARAGRAAASSSEGCGRLTMNMVLVGAEFAIARSGDVLGEFCIPSLEIAGPGGHWVEVSRAIGTPSAEVEADAGGLRGVLRGGASALRPARQRTTSTARCRRASSTAATSSAM